MLLRFEVSGCLIEQILKARSHIASVTRGTKMAARLKERYKDKIVSALMKEFSYKNNMAVPRLEKVVLNMGVGREAQANPKVFDQAAMELSTVSGQKPVITKAKKSIAAFKLRTGMPVGVSVTLRGDRMYEFLDRFINAVLPRVRDFRGISPRAFDGRGNYTIGIKDQLIFPEIDFNKVDRTRGMNVSIVTTARTDEEGRALLREFGMPFMK
jgi:large subunit ribosomal protein L5